MRYIITLVSSLFIFSTFLMSGQEGALDKSFGDDGVVYTNQNGVGYITNSLVLQEDGKIIVGGNSGTSFGISRYTTQGLLDTSFSGDGIAVINPGGIEGVIEFVEQVEVQSDGKIIATGKHIVPGNSGGGFFNFVTVRLNTDGSIDTTFGGDGIVKTDISPSMSSYSNAITSQPDGKILVGGFAATTEGNVLATVVRYTPSGELDTSFNTSGIVKTQVGMGNNTVNDILVLPDGKILIAVRIYGFENHEFALARYLSDGSLDTTFGVDGIVLTDLGDEQSELIIELALQEDNKILAAGTKLNFMTNDSDIAVVRYNTNGSIDTSFGTNGIVILDAENNKNDIAQSIAVQEDGKIVVSGKTEIEFGGQYKNVIIRLLPDGSLDTSAGDNGIIISPLITDWYFQASNMAIQADQKIVVASNYRIDFNDPPFQIILRYLPELTLGTIDFTVTKENLLVYPNPIEGQTNLDFTLLNDQKLTLALYDISGRLVKTMFKDTLISLGTHTQNLDFSEIASGNYILKLSGTEGSASVKVAKK